MIDVRTRLHKTQRYDTCGNWAFRNCIETGDLIVAVSRMRDWRYEALVAVHEIIEALLCKARGISEEAVTAFDKAHPDADEPGDHPDAPYGREHCFATLIERLLATEFGVDWAEYEKAIDAL